VVHMHAVLPGLQDLITLILDTDVPLVVTYHGGSIKKGTFFMDIVAWVYEHTFMRLMLWRANYIGCSSDFVRKEFLTRYMHKSVTLPPAVDCTVYAPHNKQEEHIPVLMCVGGLGTGEEHKGLANIITMMHTLHESDVPVRLLVAGVGDLLETYRVQVDEMGLTDSVSFLGRLDSVGMAEAYRKADIFVLPTTNDSFPTVVLEAMATGVPVVSTAVGSIADVVEHGVTGFLTQPSDMAQFLAHVRTLCDDTALRDSMGAAGRARVEKQFRWERVAENYMHIFSTVVTPKPRVVHLVSYYPPHVGGMEVVAQEVAQEVARRGYRAEVLTSREEARNAKTTERDTNLTVRRLQGIEVAHTPILLSLPFRLLVLPKGSIVHVHVAQAFLPELATCIAWLRGLKVIAHFHLDVEASGKLGFLFPAYKKYILGPVLRAADVVLVFSQEQSQLVQHKYSVDESRVHIVPNGVGRLFFRHDTEYNAHTETLRLLFVGRLAVQKRVDRLIRAVGMCNFPIHLTLVGDGELHGELETLAAEVCPGKVTFVGAKKPRQVRKFYRNTNIFVLPSDKEGMPLTALEAMASGLPVVGSDVLGIRELVNDVGVLVKDPCPENFASAFTELHNNREQLVQLRAKSIACANKHRWPHIVDSIEEIYQAL